jgi:hypothetical protein
LRELWDPATPLASAFPFQFRSGPDHPRDFTQVQLACGWRGPYVQLGLGSEVLRDGWGRLFEVGGDSQEITRVDWRPPIASQRGLDLDLSAARGTVTGNLVSDSEQRQPAEVFLLGPDPESSLSQLTVYPDEDQGVHTFTFSGVSLGIRAIVVSIQQRNLVKYVYVPRGGLSLVIDVTQIDQMEQAGDEPSE